MRERSNPSSYYPEFCLSAHNAKFLSFRFERVQYLVKRLQRELLESILNVMLVAMNEVSSR